MDIMAAQFKGLSEATRLRILFLLEEGELCVSDILSILDQPQSTLSRHLAYLRKTGWIEARRVGSWMHYKRPPHPAPFQAYLFAMLDSECAANSQAMNDRRRLIQRLAMKAEGQLNEMWPGRCPRAS